MAVHALDYEAAVAYCDNPENKRKPLIIRPLGEHQYLVFDSPGDAVGHKTAQIKAPYKGPDHKNSRT